MANLKCPHFGAINSDCALLCCFCYVMAAFHFSVSIQKMLYYICKHSCPATPPPPPPPPHTHTHAHCLSSWHSFPNRNLRSLWSLVSDIDTYLWHCLTFICWWDLTYILGIIARVRSPRTLTKVPCVTCPCSWNFIFYIILVAVGVERNAFWTSLRSLYHSIVTQTSTHDWSPKVKIKLACKKKV